MGGKNFEIEEGLKKVFIAFGLFFCGSGFTPAL
jgi:hypothetical protein